MVEVKWGWFDQTLGMPTLIDSLVVNCNVPALRMTWISWLVEPFVFLFKAVMLLTGVYVEHLCLFMFKSVTLRQLVFRVLCSF